jgi:hypothetical protein
VDNYKKSVVCVNSTMRTLEPVEPLFLGLAVAQFGHGSDVPR